MGWGLIVAGHECKIAAIQNCRRGDLLQVQKYGLLSVVSISVHEGSIYSYL